MKTTYLHELGALSGSFSEAVGRRREEHGRVVSVSFATHEGYDLRHQA